MQIVEKLRAEELSEEDLAWQKGMEIWVPLREVPDFHGGTAPRVPPRSHSGQPAETPLTVGV